MPRRSGGSFALNSGGSLNVNRAVILCCHPERSFAVQNAVEGPDYFFSSNSKPISGQIFPVRVIAFNQRILFRTSPTFQLLLPRNRIPNIPEVRAVDKP